MAQRVKRDDQEPCHRQARLERRRCGPPHERSNGAGTAVHGTTSGRRSRWPSESNVTTKNPVTVKPGSSVADAARLMKQHDVGALVVRDEQEILGLVTDRDIVVRAVATGKEGTK